MDYAVVRGTRISFLFMDSSRRWRGICTWSNLLSIAAGSLQTSMRMPSECQLSDATLRDNLQILSLRTIERAVEFRPYRANVGATSRPFILPRPDEELDSCFFNVDPYFDCLMQIEDRKNVVVDSVVFASHAIHGVHLHGFALRLRLGWQSDTSLPRVRMEPLTSAQSDATAGARIRTLHVPVTSEASSCSSDTPASTSAASNATIFRNSARTRLGCFSNWKM